MSITMSIIVSCEHQTEEYYFFSESLYLSSADLLTSLMNQQINISKI